MHRDSPLHVRRRGRNLGMLAVLLAFVAIVFAISIVKIREGGMGQSFDHVLRPEMLPAQGDGADMQGEADR